MESVVKNILASMSSIKTSHRTFLAHMFAAFMVFQGKASMTHLSRYIPVSEKRFRRHFEREFDHAQFNTQLFHETNILGKEVIAAIDASFIKKSGKKTDGLSWFYNGTAGCMQKGLEISLLALVDIQTNTAYTLEAQQTLDQPDQTRSNPSGFLCRSSVATRPNSTATWCSISNGRCVLQQGRFCF